MKQHNRNVFVALCRKVPSGIKIKKVVAPSCTDRTFCTLFTLLNVMFISFRFPWKPIFCIYFTIFQLHESMAQLITENLIVKRWLFKLDDEFDGRGIAYLDITEHLKCYNWALKEEKRYGDKWEKKWAQV